ncbi:MAG: amino acid permease, partial [Thermoplasmata archaeon]
LSAVVVCLVIYMVLAFFLAGVASAEELTSNLSILIDTAIFGPLVIAGLLAATLSSALNSMVGASRILQAMGEHNIIPKGNWFSKRSSTGEPKNAILFTALIVIGALMLRELNTVAPVITMFFLITYTMINLVILIEQSLELVSFRPLFKIPKVVPLMGTVGCLFAMFIINPIFSIGAIVVVSVFYYVLMNRHLRDTTPYGDVRSSLFVALAEWAAKKSEDLPHDYERAWRPHLLIPFTNPTEIRGVLESIRDISFPRGSVTLIGIDVSGGEDTGGLKKSLENIKQGLKDDGIHADYTIIEGHDFVHDATITIQSLKRALFSPNILFLKIEQEEGENLTSLMDKATENEMGVMLYADHPIAGLGRRHTINLWIPDECLDWEPDMKLPNCDLAILTAYKLKLNWDAELNIIATVEDSERVSEVKDNLDMLLEAARIPSKNVRVVNTKFEDYINNAPTADLNVFNLPHDVDIDELKERMEDIETSCIFCRDSTEESVLA